MRSISGFLAGLFGGSLYLLLMAIGIGTFVMMVFFTETFVVLLTKVMPWLHSFGSIGILLSIFVAAPILFFQKARPVSIAIFVGSSWLMATSLWIGSVVTMYMLWGKFPTVISILAGPLTVPIAGVGAMLKGEWQLVIDMFIAIAFWIAFLAAAAFASGLYEKRRAQLV